jgi:hypothetical protein
MLRRSFCRATVGILSTPRIAIGQILKVGRIGAEQSNVCFWPIAACR